MRTLRILIVDDEANIRKTLSVFMESGGHKVRSVECFRGALEAARTSRFALAFVDLPLGNESGLDLLQPLLRAAPG